MLLVGAGIWLLTQLVWFINTKIKTKISLRMVVVILSLIAWGIYYWIEINNPDLIEKLKVFVVWAFASSQAIWMVVDKFLPKE